MVFGCDTSCIRCVWGASCLTVPACLFSTWGTGGGFPGIPLAIAFPNIHFTLVDSIGKKIKVVQAIVDALGSDQCHGFTRSGRIRPGSF